MLLKHPENLRHRQTGGTESAQQPIGQFAPVREPVPTLEAAGGRLPKQDTKKESGCERIS